MIRVLHGDNRALLRTLPENSVDAVVTDPPYELGFMNKGWDRQGIAFDPAFWREVLRVLKPGGHMLAFGGTRTYHRIACAIEDAGFEVRDSLHWMYGSGFPKSLNGEWGGTALKPAHEPIVVARKPPTGTIASNHATYGTGALNIDGCRLAPGEGGTREGEPTAETRYTERGGTSFAATPGPRGGSAAGRWPPNVLLDPAAAEALDAQSGIQKSGVAVQRNGGGQKIGNVAYNGSTGLVREDAGYGDTGGASRFFPVCAYTDEDFWPFQYVAKAARSEREAGCENLPARAGHEVVERAEGSAGVQNPRAGAGRTAKEVRNHHPTVKPIALMRWLCRLVTPKGGLVLDPFAGSGTTGLAADREGFDAILMEREAEYLPIIYARTGTKPIDTKPRPRRTLPA